ncbi:MAG: MgtC/SapB family protein [Pseudomonas sp.]|uniref:MgtC/SapB family protein n=1 Tax=Pseudomonas sp. TaxID=306 RepID=UPI0033953086
MAGWWTEVSSTLSAEFSDIPDASELTVLCTRLLMAAFLGGILGYEREQQGKAAGIRTHMLVSMGAALFVLAPLQAGGDMDAISRVIQGLVAGIGFLGAGTILKGNGNEDQVKGLTTAAGLWLTAAIGVAVGLGRETTAVLSTLLALVIFAVIPHFTQNREKTEL